MVPFTGISQVKQLRKGTVERIKVYGKGLEGNLSGDADENQLHNVISKLIL